MSKHRRRTPQARIEARTDRADLRLIRQAMIRAHHAREELERARFWIRLGAQPPQVIHLDAED